MLTSESGHIPVLAAQVRELLAVRPGETVLDATVGLAGHAAMFGEALGTSGHLIGLDADPINLKEAQSRLATVPCRVTLRHASFASAAEVLAELGVGSVDVLLADLGVSSTQLDQAERGFSFQQDGPLDMRFDPRLTTTAADLINRLKERELADLFFYNAQEMLSRRIARRICQVRREGRITTTGRLAEVITSAMGKDPSSRKSKIHPATRTFLALRMAVNDEIPCLEALLSMAPTLLNHGGRFGVIAFHSVEDKPVKIDFRKRKAEGIYEVLTKKPIVADEKERKQNPRARSAKLRVARRKSVELQT